MPRIKTRPRALDVSGAVPAALCCMTAARSAPGCGLRQAGTHRHGYDHRRPRSLGHNVARRCTQEGPEPMSEAQTLLLGFIASATILLGLPVGKLRAPRPGLRQFLNALAIGFCCS